MELLIGRAASTRSRAVLVPRARIRRVGGSVLAVAALALSSCSSTVDITSTDLDREGEAACEALVDALPDEVFGQQQIEVGGSGIGAAWGDPPVVLTCGAPPPEEFTSWSRCSEIDGVGWFFPDQQLKDFESDIVGTVQSHEPHVRVLIPAEHRGNGPDTYLREIGNAIKEHLTETQPCR